LWPPQGRRKACPYGAHIPSAPQGRRKACPYGAHIPSPPEGRRKACPYGAHRVVTKVIVALAGSA